MTKPKLGSKSYSQAGKVTVRSLKTGEVLRTEDPLAGGVGPGETVAWWKDNGRRERRVD
jgi:hypothetical protein